jgi:site-specific DNA-methyltransferase (adenine-specific)
VIELFNEDCMELMARYPDKHFDLACVDPPYGIAVNSMNMGSRKTIKPDSRKWDDSIPDDNYFNELIRISKNQIIWGGNYFPSIWPARGFIVWDKGESMYGRSFAECEMAWSSYDRSARIYKQSPNDLHRIHPTQKPVKLYQWLLANYAKEGDKILDTHLGSGSSAIAAHYAGFDFVGCELDEDYYKAALKRFAAETAQQDMFMVGAL